MTFNNIFGIKEFFNKNYKIIQNYTNNGNMILVHLKAIAL